MDASLRLGSSTMGYDALLEECNHSPEAAFMHIKCEYDFPLYHSEMYPFCWKNLSNWCIIVTKLLLISLGILSLH